jgi:hypothetical protein
VKERRHARRPTIHWLRPGDPIRSKVFNARKPTLEVACGQALGASGFQNKATENIPDVTCAKCNDAIRMQKNRQQVPQ